MSDHPPGNRPTILLVMVVFSSAFASGFATCMAWNRDRITDEAQRLYEDMVSQSVSLGIIRVDHDRIAVLEELCNHRDR